MCAKWLNGNPPDTIVAKLESGRSQSGDQKNTWDLFAAFEINSALLSFVEFHPDLPEYEQMRIIRTALEAAAKRGKITAKEIMGEICKAENLFFARDEIPYILVTSMSIKYIKQLTPRKLPGAIVSFKKILPKRFARDKLSESARNALSADEPTTYVWVLAKTEGRSLSEAYLKAIGAIELLRGIWNFHFNLRKGLQITFMGKMK
jgi:hypothetical protein